MKLGLRMLSAPLVFIAMAGVVTIAGQTPAAAQVNDMELSFYASYWDVGDSDSSPWGPGVGVAFPVLDENLKFDLRLTWIPDAGSDGYGDVELLPLDFGLSWHYPTSELWDLFVMGGGTYAFVSSDPKFQGLGDVNSDLGGYLGVGASYKVAENVALFGDLYYRFLNLGIDVDERIYSGSDSYDADGISLDLGIKYTW